ncbi:MAG TPA: hemolysin family protein [Thermodesulfobacteriota bacterium]|nr:hemolysin family protein [Thermodesulfobacteriota bacterium]
MDDLPLSNFFLIVILLVLSGFFSMSEGALFSLGRHQREKIKKEGRKSASLIERLLKEPYKLIITILLADEVINVAYASVVASTVRSIIHGPPEQLLTAICILISSPSLLLLGEIGPKTIGVKYSRVISGIVSYPLNLFHTLITPLRWVIMVLSIGFTWLFGGKAEYEHAEGFNTDELRVLVGIGSEEGVVTEIERKLVSSLFRLEEVPAYKIMTPSIDCFFLPAGTPLAEAIYEAKKRGFSRIPVYKTDRDNVIGILYVKDLLSANPSETITVENIARPPYFIPRTKRAFDLLREFQQKRIHIAVVVDEYGRVDGIVTMEDILEELFGEIEDERRITREPLVRIEDSSLIIPGSMKIDEFNDDLLFTVLRFGGLENLGEEIEEAILPMEEDHETVGGFVFDLFGRFPHEGEQVTYGSIKFTVNKVSGKRIAEIKVERSKKEVADVA